MNDISEFRRFLIWQRHHSILNLDESAARNCGGNLRGMRIGVRIRGWCDDQCGAAHQWQARFHFIAINDAMTLGGPGTRFQRIDDEPFHQINAVGRIKSLPH